jgi:hypothetical protein
MHLKLLFEKRLRKETRHVSPLIWIMCSYSVSPMIMWCLYRTFLDTSQKWNSSSSRLLGVGNWVSSRLCNKLAVLGLASLCRRLALRDGSCFKLPLYVSNRACISVIVSILYPQNPETCCFCCLKRSCHVRNWNTLLTPACAPLVRRDAAIPLLQPSILTSYVIVCFHLPYRYRKIELCIIIIKGSGIVQSVLWLGCGLGGPGFESRQRKAIFFSPKLSRPVLVPTQPLIQQVPLLFPGTKAAGAWSWPLNFM